MDSRPSLTSSWPQSSFRPILLPFPRDLWEWSLHDVPGILGCVAELAAGDAGREAIVADGDLLIHILVGEVVRAFGHGSDEDADALVSAQGVDVVSDANDIRLEAQRHLPAVRRQVVGDGGRGGAGGRRRRGGGAAGGRRGGGRGGGARRGAEARGRGRGGI